MKEFLKISLPIAIITVEVIIITVLLCGRQLYSLGLIYILLNLYGAHL